MFEGSDRPHVAWDIETTGFGFDDRITVSGFWWPGGHADLVLNANGDDADAELAETRLNDVAGVPPTPSSVNPGRPASAL